MPVSFIDAPEGLRADAKKKLVKDVYEAFHEAYPIPDTDHLREKASCPRCE